MKPSETSKAVGGSLRGMERWFRYRHAVGACKATSRRHQYMLEYEDSPATNLCMEALVLKREHEHTGHTARQWALARLDVVIERP